MRCFGQRQNPLYGKSGLHVLGAAPVNIGLPGQTSDSRYSANGYCHRQSAVVFFWGISRSALRNDALGL